LQNGAKVKKESTQETFLKLNVSIVSSNKLINSVLRNIDFYQP
jgi:hypothetical protein